MIPPEIQYDGHATPPQWTDNADQTIEKGTQIRLKIKGMRTDMGSLYAIGTIKEVSVCSLSISTTQANTVMVGLPGCDRGELMKSKGSGIVEDSKLGTKIQSFTRVL